MVLLLKKKKVEVVLKKALFGEGLLQMGKKHHTYSLLFFTARRTLSV